MKHRDNENIKYSKICANVFPKSGSGKKKLFEEIVTDNFPNLTINPQI